MTQGEPMALEERGWTALSSGGEAARAFYEEILDESVIVCPGRHEARLGAGLNVSDRRYPRAFLQALTDVAMIGHARFRLQAGHEHSADRDDCASSTPGVSSTRCEL